jgi:hypothetical protein
VLKTFKPSLDKNELWQTKVCKNECSLGCRCKASPLVKKSENARILVLKNMLPILANVENIFKNPEFHFYDTPARTHAISGIKP